MVKRARPLTGHIWPVGSQRAKFIIQLSYYCTISDFLFRWFVPRDTGSLRNKLFDVIIVTCCISRGVNSTHHCHYTMASADSKFDDFFAVINLNKNRSAKRTCVGFDLLLFYSFGGLHVVFNVNIRELKYYKWIGHRWKDKGIHLNRLSNIYYQVSP